MAQVYLIRHGIAADRALYSDDAERPLTDQGQQKTRQVAKRLQEIGIRFEIVLTSPLVRARQTAQILEKAGLSDILEEFPALSPEGDLQEWVKWWSNCRYNKEDSCLALVGHQPDLGNWAESLIWGSSTERLTVKKAGIVGLSLPQTANPTGQCELFLLTSPKWLL